MPVGVRDVARRFRGQRLRPPRSLHPRRALLVCGPLLLHRLHVCLPQGVQDKPLLPYKGMYYPIVVPKHICMHTLLLAEQFKVLEFVFNTVSKCMRDSEADLIRIRSASLMLRRSIYLSFYNGSEIIPKLVSFAFACHLRLHCHLLVVKQQSLEYCSLRGRSMRAISVIYHWGDSSKLKIWRDSEVQICSLPAPPGGDKCCTVVWLLVSKVSQNICTHRIFMLLSIPL